MNVFDDEIFFGEFRQPWSLLRGTVGMCNRSQA